MLGLVAVLINWFVTTIFVESKLFMPLRDYAYHHAWYCNWQGVWHRCGGTKMFVFPEGTTEEEAAACKPVMRGPWLKATQLVTCHLCTRTWVGFAEAAYFGGPVHGWAALIGNGLLYAAGGHLVYSAEAVLMAARHRLDPLEPLLLGREDNVGEGPPAAPGAS